LPQPAYIYPFRSFGVLAADRIRDRFRPARRATTEELRSLLAAAVPSPPHLAGDSPAARILSLFLDPEFGLGPSGMIEDRRTHWLERFAAAARAEQPLTFVIMACPFKVPVPLKTVRMTADLGEALLLARLAAICSALGAIHPPGARVLILAEGILGQPLGIGTANRRRYLRSLRRLHMVLGFAGGPIEIFDLDQIRDSIPGFDRLWQAETNGFRGRRIAGEPAATDAFARTWPAIFRIVPSRHIAVDLLLQAYDLDRPAMSIAPEAATVRAALSRQADVGTDGFHGFLAARDRSAFLSARWPGFFKLTVSPKPGDLAIHPVNRTSRILPYHGVPVRDAGGDFSIAYHLDLRCADHWHRPVHWDQDEEDAPFFYEQAQ